MAGRHGRLRDRLRPLLATALLSCAAVLASPAFAEAGTVWLCKPGVEPNPCVMDMRTTVNEPSGGSRVTDEALPADPPVDCFYVYPTVSNQPTPNAFPTRDPELRSIAMYQAARFSSACDVFAPVYRQRTLLALAASRVIPEDPRWSEIAYADVLAAWREYLARDSGGRGVVLIGHSQGTRMLRRLIREEIDPDPVARDRLVGGILLGGDVTVRAGSTVGGDFEHVPLCTSHGQFGCIVAYSTFAEDPPPDSRYGRAEPGYEVACTDPSVLSGTGVPLRALQPSEPFAPGLILAGIAITYMGPPPFALTPWVVPPDRFSGACRRINGAHVLRYEPLPGSRRPHWFPEDTWGTHLVDMNLGLEELVEIVRAQTTSYLAAAAG